MSIASEVAQRIAGTYIEDAAKPKTALFQWLQLECRSGQFHQAIAQYARTQPEPLRPDLVLVEEIKSNSIVLKLPCQMADHESTSTFRLDVLLELNPVTLAINRI